MITAPLAALLRSRKFLIALLDALLSSVTLLAVRFLSPGDVELVRNLIVIYQPVILAVIALIAVEDVAKIRAQGRIDEAIIYNDTKPLKPK